MFSCYFVFLSCLNLSFVRNDIMNKHFGTCIVRESQLKKNKDYQDEFAPFNDQVQKDRAILDETLDWLLLGLRISENWISHVPDNAVQEYLNIRGAIPPFQFRTIKLITTRPQGVRAPPLGVMPPFQALKRPNNNLRIEDDRCIDEE